MDAAQELAYSYGFTRGMIYMLAVIIACVCLYMYLDDYYWLGRSVRVAVPIVDPAATRGKPEPETPVTETGD